MSRLRRIGAFALLPTLALALASGTGAPATGAVEPTPTPSAALGYSGKGAIVLQTTLGGTKLTVGGDVGFEQRADLMRIDVLSIKIPGMDPTMGAAAGTELFPGGGFTVVLDRANSRYTVWSQAKQSYYVGTIGPGASPGPSPKPTPTPTPNPSATPGGGPFDFLKNLKDYKTFTITVGLAGHSVTNGHPTTGLNFQFLTETVKGKKVDVHGALQSADDLDGLPVQLTASFTGTDQPESAARIDVTTIERRLAPAADFAVPKGFTKAASVFDVIGANLPGLPGH